MPTFVPDFVDALEQELATERERLARLLNRIEALTELHDYAYDLAARLRKPLTVEDVFDSGHSEQQRAKLRALAERITASEQGGIPAYDSTGDGGNSSESGAEF